MQMVRACSRDGQVGRVPEKDSLEIISRRIDEAPVTLAITADILEAVRGPDPEPDALVAVLESDAPLKTTLLRAVNSSASGSRAEIEDIQQAAVLLGTRQLARLAMTAALSRVFGDKSGAVGPYRRASLWRHMVAVGLGARMIAHHAGLEEPEEAFSSGLLHDLGIILEDQYVHGPFCDLVRTLDGRTTLGDAERTRLGFDHTLLGERAAELWGLPEAVSASIRHHHGSAHYEGAHVAIVRCVEAANVLCTIKGISSVGGAIVCYAAPVFISLALGKKDILELASQLSGELLLGTALFRM